MALGKDAATAGDRKRLDVHQAHLHHQPDRCHHAGSNCWAMVSRHASERPDALLKGHILAEQSDLHGVIDADLFTWPTEVEERIPTRIARVAEQLTGPRTRRLGSTTPPGG